MSTEGFWRVNWDGEAAAAPAFLQPFGFASAWFVGVDASTAGGGGGSAGREMAALTQT